MNTIEDIMKMSREDFLLLVNDDIRGIVSPAVADALRSPRVASVWYDALVSMKRSTETQLAADKAERSNKRLEIHSMQEWLEFKAKRDTWRSGAIRFKNGVEDKIAEAKSYLRQEVLV